MYLQNSNIMNMSLFSFMLRQRCAYGLVRLRIKNTWPGFGKDHAWLTWFLPPLQLQIVPTSLQKYPILSQTRLECPCVYIPGIHTYSDTNSGLWLGSIPAQCHLSQANLVKILMLALFVSLFQSVHKYHFSSLGQAFTNYLAKT